MKRPHRSQAVAFCLLTALLALPIRGELQNAAYMSDADATSEYSSPWLIPAAVNEVTGNNGFHTGSTAGDQYWWTDLGALIPIHSVKVVARTGYDHRINNCEIKVYESSDIDLSGATPVYTRRVQIRSGTTQTFVLPESVYGRSVKVHRVSGTDHINLSELYVYSDNLARGKAASQSTDQGSGSYPASRAVDGIRTGAGTDFTHTDGTDANPWWKVDLGEVANIDGIKLWNRVGFEERLADINVQVYGNDDTTLIYDYNAANGELINTNNWMGGPRVITVDIHTNAVQGRYIKVTRVAAAGNVLSLSEVEAYGTTLVDSGDYDHRMKITFSGYSSGATLTNFPALVNLGPGAVEDFAYSQFESGSGSDLRFIDSDGVTELHYEIEEWDTNGTSAVWVRVPELASTGADYIWAYWGSTNDLTYDADTFDPTADISDCVVWLDADDIDGQGNTTLSDGGSVFSWTNKATSGSVGDFAASGSNDADPTFVATNANFNNKPAVRFNGNNATESVLFNAYNFAAPSTIIYVSRLTGSGNFRLLSGHGNNWLLGYHGGTKDDAFYNGWVYNGGVAADTATYVHTAVIPAAGDCSFIRNGAVVAANTGGTTGPNGLRLGGGYLANNEHSSGEIVELLVYNRALTDEECNQVGVYLQNKYALTTVHSDPDAPAYTRDGSTWDVSYGGVWHLNDPSASGGTGESTAGDYDGINSGTVNIAGKIAGARDWPGANSIVLPVGSVAGLSDQVTVSLWVNGDASQPRQDSAFEVRNGANRIVHAHLPWSDGNVYWDAGYSSGYDRINKLASPGEYEQAWNQWVFTKNVGDGTMRIYVNGTQWHSGTGKVKGFPSPTSFRLGSYADGSMTYRGSIDEFRVSDVERSAGWIGAAYSNQAENASFVTYDKRLTASDYSNRMKIVFRGYDSGATLTNFPALVKLGPDAVDDFDYGEFGSANGGDLRFTDSDGTTVIPYEIEEWDTDGTSVVWVKVPELESTGEDHIWAYWGNASLLDYDTDTFDPGDLSNCRLWLDADAGITTNGSGTVTSWADQSGNGNNATLQGGTPVETSNALNGHSVVTFDADGNSWFSFPQMTDIRTIFWVIREDTVGDHFLLGDNNAYHFHRNGAYLWHGTHAHANIKNGTTRLMGTVVSGTTTRLGGGYRLVSVVTAGGVEASRICNDRDIAGRSWDGDMAELIIYNRALTDGEERKVGHYLARKYGFTCAYPDPNAPAYTRDGSTWNEGFGGVWHMAHENPADSTANGNQGTGYNTPTVIDGNTADGLAMADTGEEDDIRVNDHDTIDPASNFTASIWVNTTMAGAWFRNLMGNFGAGGGGGTFWGLGWMGAGDLGFVARVAGDTTQLHSSGYTDGNWHHLVGQKDGDAIRLYIDGSPIQSGVRTGGVSNAEQLWFCNHGNYGSGVNATIDEARISRVVRSADWIAAAYDNQAENGSFVKYEKGLSYADYDKRLKIVFGGYTGSTTLTNYPALVQFSEAMDGFTYDSFASAFGSDLRFADSDGITPLNYEIESWDTNGASAVWVQVAELEGTGTDYIWAYWGNANGLTYDSDTFDPDADVSDCRLWLKADVGLTTNAGGTVTSWTDQSGNGNNATLQDGTPVETKNALNGHSVVTFDPDGNSWFSFPQMTDIRTVFWVIKEDTVGTHFLLGDNDKYHFHRNGANIWANYGPQAMVVNGTTRLMGAAVDGRSTALGSGYRLVSLVTTGGAEASRLSEDRTQTARSWDGDVAELIIYNRALTDEEENKVGRYLARKYDLGTGYFDPNAPSYAHDGSAWSADYAAVYHLNAGNYKDSTANRRDGMSFNGAAAATGTIAGGTDFDGGNDFVRIPENFGIFENGPYTVSHWLNTDTLDTANRITFCAGGERNYFHSFGDGGPSDALGVRENDGSWQTPVHSGSLQANRWYHFSTSFDTTDGYRLHLDGSLKATNSRNLAHSSRTGDNRLGSLGNNSRWFDGTLDEVRVSTVIRSDDWIDAEYEMVANADTFATYRAVISNEDPTDVSKYSANLNGALNFTDGLSTTVKVFWGTTDGGDSYGGWDHTNTVTTTSSTGAVQQAVSGLTAVQRYYYRYYATNANGEVWTTVPMTFVTRPTDAAGMQLWLTADAIDGVSHGSEVPTWIDISGNDNHATAANANSGILTTNVLNGAPVVRFDGVNGHYYNFNRISNIRTVFWVVKEDPSSTTERFLLGDDSYYDFHRGGVGAGGRRYIWNGTHAWRFAQGSTYLDGAEIDGTTTLMPTNHAIIVATGTADARANRLVDDRGITSRSWHGDIAEVMIYSEVLSAGEVNEVGAYLAEKYGLDAAYEDEVIDPAQFAHKRKIQVNGYTGGETLTDFPVLVKFEDGGAFNYGDCVSATGGDLRFALDSTGDALSFDIDLWDTNGESIVWVMLPALTNGTTFWAYWGNPSQTGRPYYVEQGGAWAADYGGVWHLNEINAADSAPYGNDGTAGGSVGVTLADDGRIGKSVDLPGSSGTGGTGYVSVPSSASIEMGNTFSVSAWVTYERIASNNQWERMFSKKNVYNGGDGWEVGHNQNSDTQMFLAGSAGSSGTRPAVTDSWRAGQWLHLTFAYDGSTVHTYADGAFKGDVPCTAVVDNSGRPFVMGNNAVYGEYNWNGKIDEVRLADAVRSADWVKAAYDAVANHDTFVIYDDQVTVRDPSDLATTSATLNGDLAWTDGLSTEVKVVYGTNDAGAAFGSWGSTAAVTTVSSPTSLVYSASGLQSATTYYYRFYATNTSESGWSHVGSFRSRFADVADLALWWDASAIPGATNNGPVATWTDWSGNKKDGSQAVGERRPTLLGSGLNGKPVVRLDGSDDGAYYDGSLYANTDYTIFMVEGRRSTKANNYILIGSTASGNQNLHYGYRSDTAFTHAQYANDYDMAVAGYGTQEFHIWASTLNSAEAQGRRTYRDGVYMGKRDVTTPMSSYRGATLGTWPNQGRYFAGDIAEYIVFDRALSPAEQNLVGAYLAEKYGMDTPYESAVDTGDYAHSLDITFDNYTGSETLTNFPALVQLSEAGLPDFLYSQFSSTNGWDLRFTMQGENNLLNYEIEDWSTGGTSFVWVRIPAFTNNTTITAYWGNPSAPDVEPFYAASGGVWDDTFRGVWHLDETNYPYSDSTWNLRNGTTGTQPGHVATGLIGPSPNFSGGNFKIDVPYTAALNPGTYSISFWARVDGAAGTYRSPVTSRRGGPPQQGYIAYALNNNTWSYWQGTGTAWANVGGPAVTVGQVAHITMTYDGSQMRHYFNGLSYGPTTAGLQANNAYPLRFGAGGTEGGGNYWFDGLVDEVRVSRVVRSHDWHDASYANVSDYANFTTFGDVQGPAPYVENLAATLVIDTNATINAYMNATGDVPTYAWFYWGSNYHETSGWEITNALGLQTNGYKHLDLTNLTKTVTYYYRLFASNTFGTTWGEPTTNFTTLDTYYIITPGSGPNGSIAPSLLQYVSEATDSAVFTFPADYGYHLTNVLVDGSLIGVTNQYQFFSVYQDHSITSYYGINYYDISVVQGAGGSIAPASPAQVMHGMDSPVFLISANAGSFLTDVQVDGVSQGLIDSYQFTNVQTGHTITATFETYPDSIPRADLAFWIQADDLNLTNGALVETWYESTHTNNLLQPNMGLQPTMVTNGFNGHKAVSFGGLQSMTNLAMNADWPTNNATILVVARADTLAQNSHLYRSQPWSATRFSTHFPWGNGNNYFDYGQSAEPGRMFWGNAGTDAPNIWCLVNEAGVYQAAWQNGTLKKSETTTGTWNPAGYAFEVGATYQGDIAELIIFNTALDEIDRNRVGYYLQEKYGLATDYVDPQAADIGVSMQLAYLGRTVPVADGVAALQGGHVQYAITVTNSGPTNVTNLIVSDLLPSGLTYQSHAGGTYNDGSGQWDVGALAYQGSTTLTVTASVDADVGYVEIVNTASVTSLTENELVSGNNSASQTLRVWHDAVDTADYTHRVKITFPGYTRAGITLTNFPALVTLNTGITGFSYDGFDSAIGADLKFTEADGTTVVAHEIEQWDASGDSLAYVRLPELQVGTYIWAYWGNDTLATYEHAATVTNVSDCVLWLRADAGVLTSGSAVTNWQDQSGNGNHVSQSNAAMQPTLVSGVAALNSQPAVRFDDAADDGVGLGPANLGIASTDDRTVIMVVIPDSTLTQGSEVIGQDTGHMFDFGTWTQNHRLRVRNDAVNAFSGWNSVRYDRPHVLSVVGSGGGTTLTTWNGGEAMDVNSSPTTAFQWPMTALYVGLCSNIPDRSYEGDMAELIVYDRALSRDELARIGMYLTAKYAAKTSHNQPAYTYDGTVWTEGYRGVWHMDGKTIVESTASDAYGRPALPVPAAGQIGEAQSYGGNSEIDCGNRCSINGNDDFTVSAWVNTSLLGTQRIFQQRNGGYNGEFMFTLDAAGKLNFVIYRNGYGFNFSGNQVVADGGWHHVTGIRQGSKGTLYVDAAYDAEQDPGGGTRWLDPNIYCGIGRDIRDNNGPFNGLIDEVRLANKARGTNWLWAAFMNTASNGTFLGFDEFQNKPVIENFGATYVSRTNAQFNGSLTSTGGLPTQVWMFWDTADHGTSKAAWGNTNAFAGDPSEGAVYTNLYTLSSSTTYHYAYYASNSYGDGWAQPSTSFQTAASNEFAISAVAAAGGSIVPSGVAFVLGGSNSATYAFNPNEGYHLTNVVVDGTPIGTPANHQFTNVGDDHTIEALFGINMYTITVAQATGGTIAPDPADDVPHGSDSQTFTINASTGYYLENLVVDGQNQGQLFSYQFTGVTNDHSITALFATRPALPVTDTLAFWVDADTITGTNGQPVSLWQDLSGNDRHATQADSDRQPAYSNSMALINGHAAIRLDSADDGMEFDGSFLTGTDYTVIVVEGRRDTGVNYLLTGSAPTANNNLHAGYRNNTTITHDHWATGYNMGVAGYSSQQFKTHAYWLKSGTGRRVWLNGGLLGSSGTFAYLASYNGATIGGNPAVANPYGGDIAEVIIYTKALTDEEHRQVGRYLEEKYQLGAAYPSETLPAGVDDPVLWVSANELVGYSDGDPVSLWPDISGSNRSMNNGSGKAVFKENQLNGMPAVRFTGNDDDYFTFGGLTTIRTVFWVVREVEDPAGTAPRFLLGHAGGNTYHFHRASDGGNIWNSSHAPLCFNGTTKLRGFEINGRTTDMPTDFAILSVRTSGNATANSFSRDRSINGRSWHGDLAEMLIYTRVLSESEERQVGDFLKQKYKMNPSLFIIR